MINFFCESNYYIIDFDKKNYSSHINLISKYNKKTILYYGLVVEYKTGSSLHTENVSDLICFGDNIEEIELIKKFIFFIDEYNKENRKKKIYYKNIYFHERNKTFHFDFCRWFGYFEKLLNLKTISIEKKQNDIYEVKKIITEFP